MCCALLTRQRAQRARRSARDATHALRAVPRAPRASLRRRTAAAAGEKAIGLSGRVAPLRDGKARASRAWQALSRRADADNDN